MVVYSFLFLFSYVEDFFGGTSHADFRAIATEIIAASFFSPNRVLNIPPSLFPALRKAKELDSKENTSIDRFTLIQATIFKSLEDHPKWLKSSEEDNKMPHLIGGSIGMPLFYWKNSSFLQKKV